MSRQRILQIFSRYEHFGGEEGSVTRIGDTMQADFDVEYFFSSTADLLQPGLQDRISLPLRLLHNGEVKKRLLRYQKIGRFDFWQVHNVFPGMSPVVYRVAESQAIPVIQYLHNYRFSCVNGFFLNHGQPCQRCIRGNFFPAFATACWHESRVYSGAMGIVLKTVQWQNIFSKIARFIAISHRQKELHVAMGIPAEKIDVIHHFLEPTRTPSPFNPDGHALFIGRLSPEKGGLQLLQAWQHLGQTSRQLVIVGDGPDKPHLEKFCREHDLKNVIFTGFLKAAEQQKIWADSAFTVVPSIWEEPFGMVVLESWAHQRPVVAYRIGALPELIDHGSNGLLCDPFSPEDLATSMDLFFSNPKMTKSCGKAGHQKLLSQFNQTVWLDKIKSTYTSILTS